MLEHARRRTAALEQRMADAGLGLALITDESSIAYLAGFWGYLSVEFGRPTLLVLRPGRAPVVLTPAMESELVGAMTWIEDVRCWQDAGPARWEHVLGDIIGVPPSEIGVERDLLPAVVRNWLDARYPATPLRDVSPLLGAMRMIKGAEEIVVMREAGRVAGAMMAAAEGALAEGVAEYEAALAVIEAGTRAAAGFLTDRGWEAFVSPLIHNLQIMQSGRHTSMVHRRATTRRLERGDPVYFCFCNLAEFKHYRLGFDRLFFVGEARDEALRVQRTAIEAQAAALGALRAGVTAESVAAAADEVYRARGFAPGYRTGRSIGMAYLEAPELKPGDTTVLAPGMTFAVDGGVTVAGGLGGRIGDSVVVTADGFEFLTDYPRAITVV